MEDKTVWSIIEGSEPVKDLELFCVVRPEAFNMFKRLCSGYKNPKTENVWVLTGVVIQKICNFATQNGSYEALKDSDVLSDWLIKNLERCRAEKINAGLPVPAR